MTVVNTFISKLSLLSIVKRTSLVESYYTILITEMNTSGINTKYRVCAFLAQILHESGCLFATKENLFYTATGLQKTWPSKFTSLDFAKTFEKQPEKIANYVYGGRMGNNEPGDGWKYIGRGLIGVTGKDNYAALSKDTGIDFVANPELLEQPKYAVISAINFWNKYKLNAFADSGDFKAITQRINGGQLGADDRVAKYQQLLSLASPIAVEIVEN